MTETQLLMFGLDWNKSGSAMRFLLVPSSDSQDVVGRIARALEIADDEVVLVSPNRFSAVKNFRWGSGLAALLEHWKIEHDVDVDAYLIKSTPQCEHYETMLGIMFAPNWKMMFTSHELALCNCLPDGGLQIDDLPDPQCVNRLSDAQLKADFTQLLQLLEGGVFERAIHTTIEERITAGWQ